MRAKYTFLIITILTATLLSSCASRERTFPKGTSINGADISGKTAEAARDTVTAACDETLKELKYTVKIGDREEKLLYTDLGLKCDTEKALSQALTDGGDIQADLIMDEQKAKGTVKRICDKYTVKPVSATAEYDGMGNFIFTEGQSGMRPDSDALYSELIKAVNAGKSAVIIAKQTEIKPTTPDYNELKAANSLIAEYTTSFAKSPLNAENRVKNIKKAAEKVNGTILGVGATFDTNAILGDRNEENGWYTAPGIVNGKYRQEYGGGVCQVSSTLYNAALLANLKIDERTPHSIPVSYVPLGRDATISTGGPNLIFTNSTGGRLTIAAVVDDDNESITVRLFGTKNTEYDKVEIYSEQTGVIYAPSPQYVRDTSLRAGEYVTDRKARNGKKSATYRIFYDENGEKIKAETVSRDTYTAFSAIVLYND